MSVTFSRVRGDNYPIEATITVNGVAVDLTGSTMTFSFKLADDDVVEAPIEVDGVLGDEVGLVLFTPTVQQMGIVGQYDFDIQRENGGVVATHLTGTMLLTKDVTPNV